MSYNPNDFRGFWIHEALLRRRAFFHTLSYTLGAILLLGFLKQQPRLVLRQGGVLGGVFSFIFLVYLGSSVFTARFVRLRLYKNDRLFFILVQKDVVLSRLSFPILYMKQWLASRSDCSWCAILLLLVVIC